MNWNIFYNALFMTPGINKKIQYKRLLRNCYGNKYCDALYLLLLGSMFGKNGPQNMEVPLFKTYSFLLLDDTFFVENITANSFSIILIFYNHFPFDLPPL